MPFWGSPFFGFFPEKFFNTPYPLLVAAALTRLGYPLTGDDAVSCIPGLPGGLFYCTGNTGWFAIAPRSSRGNALAQKSGAAYRKKRIVNSAVFSYRRGKCRRFPCLPPGCTSVVPFPGLFQKRFRTSGQPPVSRPGSPVHPRDSAGSYGSTYASRSGRPNPRH